jgi:ubiquinone/menaquinone biosynthesis C-methylase UbiE
MPSIAFDRAAEYYDETRGFPPGEESRIADLFRRAGGLTRASRVLEIGVGTGRIALPLAAHVRAITGIDLARPMLARLLAKRTVEPVFPLQGDATRLPFPRRAFDAIAACHVFHLIPDWQTALTEAARVLRPGGVLISGWNDSKRRDPGNDVLWSAWESVAGAYTQRTAGVSREQLATFLPESGWQPVGEALTHTYTIVQTPQTFLDRLERRVWSSLWSLPDEVVAQGIAAVRAAMHEHGIDPQQPGAVAASFHVRAFAPPV